MPIKDQDKPIGGALHSGLFIRGICSVLGRHYSIQDACELKTFDRNKRNILEVRVVSNKKEHDFTFNENMSSTEVYESVRSQAADFGLKER